VQVASIDTLHVRGVRSNAMSLPPADLLVFDEAHRARGRTREHLISLYPDANLIGMTATPVRGDGRGLGNIFDVIIECPQVAALIVGGYLVPSRVYAPVDPDLRGVRTQQGDYLVGQLERRMNTDALVGDIVEHWLKYGERRRTVCFAVGVEHSVHICNEFKQAGVRAEHLDGETPITARAEILARLASRETEVVCNCMVLTEGWDCPPVGCEILARPTKQMGLFRQMIGRVLRPADGKPDAIILDHSGAVYRHGLPEDHIEWTLAVDQRAVNPAQVKRERGEAPKLSRVPIVQGGDGCSAVRRLRMAAAAPRARHRLRGRRTRPRHQRQVQCAGLHARTKAHLVRDADRRSTASWQEARMGLVSVQGQFAHEPHRFWNRTALAPAPEVSNYVRSRIIAYAKRRAAA
jgi:DNA repair protein RadD